MNLNFRFSKLFESGGKAFRVESSPEVKNIFFYYYAIIHFEEQNRPKFKRCFTKNT